MLVAIEFCSPKNQIVRAERLREPNSAITGAVDQIVIKVDGQPQYEFSPDEAYSISTVLQELVDGFSGTKGDLEVYSLTIRSLLAGTS